MQRYHAGALYFQLFLVLERLLKVANVNRESNVSAVIRLMLEIGLLKGSLTRIVLHHLVTTALCDLFNALRAFEGLSAVRLLVHLISSSTFAFTSPEGKMATGRR